MLTTRSLLILALLGAGIALFSLPRKAPAGEKAAPTSAARLVPVALEQPRAVHGWHETQRFTGIAQARRQSKLGFEREGKVIALMVDLGSQVEAGAALAQLDAEHLNLRRAEAQAALAQERSALEEALVGPRSETMDQARSQVRRLDIEIERLDREAARHEDLLAEGVSAAEEFETLRFAAAATRAQREGALAVLAELEAGTRVERITQHRALLALAEARLAQLQHEIDRSTLRAPYPGTVMQRMIDEGEVVAAGSPVLLLQESAALEARIGVPEALAAKLEIGQRMSLQMGDRTIEARLRAALPEIDPATRSRTLILDLEGGNGLAGATLAWQAEIYHPGEGWAIPTTALVASRRGLWAVYLAQETEAGFELRRQEIELLHAGSDEVIVRGLRTDDKLVAIGTDRVVPGQLVQSAEAE